MFTPSRMKCIPWVALLALASLSILPWVESSFQGIKGNFCRNRKPSECCTDRKDNCSVPIQGTHCYCDEHCITDIQGDHTANDCCPDFYEVCLMQSDPTYGPPPKYEVCKKDGFNIPDGKSLKFNCNECQCNNGKLVCEQDACMVEGGIISTINQALKYGWTASNYPEYWRRKAEEGLRLKTGTFNPTDQSQEMNPIRQHPDVSRIPASFDARKKREWAGRIGDVCDQGWCGSSWAFSTLGVAQDRLSILARGHGRLELSAQNLLSCAKLGQEGCEGGHIDRAWNYLRFTGLVREECYKYESGQSGKVPRCLIPRNDLSRLTCESKDHFKMEPAYRISGKEEDIQWEILNNGPVQAMMTVHRDLFMYKTGVYSYSGLTNILEAATHSVRIIGWGSARNVSSQSTKYWVVANSWGTQWGEGGYFRINRGINECEIESFVIAARARLTNFVYGKGHNYKH